MESCCYGSGTMRTAGTWCEQRMCLAALGRVFRQGCARSRRERTVENTGSGCDLLTGKCSNQQGHCCWLATTSIPSAPAQPSWQPSPAAVSASRLLVLWAEPIARCVLGSTRWAGALLSAVTGRLKTCQTSTCCSFMCPGPSCSACAVT